MVIPLCVLHVGPVQCETANHARADPTDARGPKPNSNRKYGNVKTVTQHGAGHDDWETSRA